MGEAMTSAGGTSLSAKVLKAMSVFTGVQAVGILCSIVRAKLIALWIGTVGVGLFATFNTAIDLLAAATQLNIRQSSVRDIAAASKKMLPNVVSAVRWWALRLGIAGTILMLMLSPVLSLISFGHYDYWWAFAILAIVMLAMSVTVGEQSIMQGTASLHALARTTLIGATAGTMISVPLYYYLGEWSIIPSIIIFAVANLSAVMLLRRHKGSRNASKDNVDIGKKFIRLGAYLTVPTIATTGMSYIFISYLNNTVTPYETGIFQAGYTLIIRYTGIVFTALSMEYYPRISRIAMRSRMASTVVSHEMLLILYVLTPLLVVFVAADELAIRLLYTDDFLSALPFVTIGILAMVFRGISYCMAYVIIARGDGRVYILTELISAIIGLGLNIYMFSHYSFIGLGISYVMWYLLYTIIIAIPYRLRYGMHLTHGAMTVGIISILIISASICLKYFGWAMPLLMLIPACAISYIGYKRLKR